MWQAQEFARSVGTVLCGKYDDGTHDQLPERWVELIHYRDEKERRKERARQRKARSRERN
jgi:hypothetical protein